MPETPSQDINIRPGEETFVHDPAKAELMAYAEKPHREYANALKEVVEGEMTEQLEEYYQKNPDHRKVTWEQKGDDAYRDRDDLLADKRDYLGAADKAVKLGELRAWGVSKRYDQAKEAEAAQSKTELQEVETKPVSDIESVQESLEKEPPEQKDKFYIGVARMSSGNIPSYPVNEEELIRKTRELVESGQITESLTSSKNAAE